MPICSLQKQAAECAPRKAVLKLLRCRLGRDSSVLGLWRRTLELTPVTPIAAVPRLRGAVSFTPHATGRKCPFIEIVRDKPWSSYPTLNDALRNRTALDTVKLFKGASNTKMVQTSTIVAATVGTVATGLVGKAYSPVLAALTTDSVLSLCRLLRSSPSQRSRVQETAKARVKETGSRCEGGG